MSNIMQGKHVFPGGNTPLGFYSYFDDILKPEEAKKIICIKGGPGTGKSTFMKKIALEMFNKGYKIEYMHCASDPDSIDGILIKELNIALFDATSPHIIDPKNLGIVDEILYLGDYLNEESLKRNKDEIMRLNNQKPIFFNRAYKYLAAAKHIYDDNLTIYNEKINISGIYKELKNIYEKEFKGLPLENKSSRIRRLFCSAITPKGLVNFLDTILKESHKTYIVNGINGRANDTFFSNIKEMALSKGLDIELYYCPIKPDRKIEHIIIKELDLAFITSNKYHLVEVENESNKENCINIDLKKYLNKSYIIENCETLDYNEKLFDELINRAIYMIKKASEKHSELEKYYIPNMDFNKLELCYNKTLNRILKYS